MVKDKEEAIPVIEKVIIDNTFLVNIPKEKCHEIAWKIAAILFPEK